MATVNVEDLAKAQKNFMLARNQALQDAQGQSDQKAALAAQQSVLLTYLQQRVKLLTDAKAKTIQQFDDEIGKFQVRIGELNQQMQQLSVPAPTGDQPPSGAATGGSPGDKGTTGAKATAVPQPSSSARSKPAITAKKGAVSSTESKSATPVSGKPGTQPEGKPGDPKDARTPKPDLK